MKHFLFSGDETPDEIRRILVDNSDGQEQRTYTRPLTEQELIDLRNEYVETNLTVRQKQDELNEAKERYKVATKELIANNRINLQVLKTKHKEVKGTVYMLPNHDTGMMEFVNESGLVIETRRLKDAELNRKIFPMRKAVNE